MVTLMVVIEFVIILWAALYTVSYGVWVWKRKFRLGALAVFLLSAAVIAVPIYAMFFIG